MNSASAVSRRILLALAALTAIGFALRLSRYQEGLFGDETSTLYLTDGRSLGEVLSLVSSDKEITPPFYFLLAWAAEKLGSAPELMRLPSLISGTLAIPLTYLLGARIMNRSVGLIAAGLVTLSPTLIFFSGDGRAYALAIALLLGSALAMLAGARTGRTRWWIAYAVLSCLAMYTHYTAAFVLIAQLGWLLWAHPEARRAAILANVGAALAYLPWAPWLIADSHSPTVDILSALQGTGFAVKRYAVEVWSVGYPFMSPEDLPGVPAAVLGLLGVLIAVIATVVRRIRREPGPGESRREFDKGLALAIALALAAPVLELLLLPTGNNLFGSRNLNVSWPGLALSMGGLIVAAGRLWGTIAAIAVFACFGYGAARTLEVDTKLPAFEQAADYIDADAGPDDVVLDLLSPRVTPVPLTSLDAYLPQTRAEFRPLLPLGEPPFVGGSEVPPTEDVLREAVAAGQGHRLFVVAGDGDVERDGDRAVAINVPPVVEGTGPTERYPLPPGSRVVAEHRWEGLGPVSVVVVEVPAGSGNPAS